MADVLEILKKLPPVAFVQNILPDGKRRHYNTDAPVIGIKRGEPGFHPIYTQVTADDLNDSDGVTPAQREAMYFGSLFGWHTPGADPDRYDADGTLKDAPSKSQAP